MNVLMCGPFPLPVGGVSVHIHRLSMLLLKNRIAVDFCDESRVIKEGVFNIRSLSFLVYFKKLYRADLVHVHSGPHLLRIFHVFFAVLFRKKIIVTLHSWVAGKLVTFLWSLILFLFKVKVIFVSDHVKRQFFCPGVVIPAFLPPDMESESQLPLFVHESFKKSRLEKRFILISNAFRLDSHQGVDLYGLDICIDLMKNEWFRNNCTFFYVVSDPSTSVDYIRKIKQDINNSNLNSVFHLHLGFLSFPRLLALCDASIRCTNTDGDAISVRESLWFNKITLASDAAARPAGCLVFRTRDVVDLAAQLKLSLLDFYQTNSPSKTDDLLVKYFEVYNFKRIE